MLHLSILATWKQTWVFFSLLCIFIVSKGRKTHTSLLYLSLLSDLYDCYWLFQLFWLHPFVLITGKMASQLLSQPLFLASDHVSWHIDAFSHQAVNYRSKADPPSIFFITVFLFCIEPFIFLVFKGKKIITYSKYHDLNVTFYTW